MRTRSYVILAVCVAAAGIATFFLSSPSTVTAPAVSIPAATSTNATGTAQVPSVSPQAANVTLIAGSSTYAAYIPGPETVAALMRQLASTTGFNFTGKEYPSLGLFVESIDGTQNHGSDYWFLYIDGTSSMKGASTAMVHPGDTIEWKYENESANPQ